MRTERKHPSVTRVYEHSVSIHVSGQVEAIDGDRIALRVGYNLWPLRMDETQRLRPTVGQHITIVGNPTGIPPFTVDDDHPINVWSFHPERYPKTPEEVLDPTRPREKSRWIN